MPESDTISINLKPFNEALASGEQHIKFFLDKCKGFQTTLDDNFTKPINGAVDAVGKMVGTLNDVRGQITNVSDGIKTIYVNIFKAVDVEGSKKKISPITQLKKIIESFSSIKAGSFISISKGFSSLANGINTLSKEADIGTASKNVEEVRKLINNISISSEIPSTDSTSFSEKSVAAVTKIGEGLQKLSNALRAFPTDSAFSDDSNKIENVGKRVNSLFKKLNNSFKGQNITTSKGEHKVVELAESRTLALNKVATALKNFTTAVTNVTVVTQPLMNDIKSTITGFVDTVNTVFTTFDGAFSGKLVESSTRKGLLAVKSTEYKVIDTAESKTLGIKRVADAVKSFVDAIVNIQNNVKVVTVSHTTALNSMVTAIANVFTTFDNAFSGKLVQVTSKDKQGNVRTSEKVIATAEAKTLAIKQVASAIKSFTKTIVFVQENVKTDVSSYATALNSMVTAFANVFTTFDKAFSGRLAQVTSKDKHGNVRTSEKVVDTAESKTLAIKQVASAIKSFAKTVVFVQENVKTGAILYANTINAMVDSFENVFSTFDKAFSGRLVQVTSVDKQGNVRTSEKVVDAAGSKTLAIKQVASAIKSFAKTVVFVQENVKTDVSTCVSALNSMVDAIANVFTTFDKAFSGKLVESTFEDKNGNVKISKKVIDTAESKTLAIKQVASAIKSFAKTIVYIQDNVKTDITTYTKSLNDVVTSIANVFTTFDKAFSGKLVESVTKKGLFGDKKTSNRIVELAESKTLTVKQVAKTVESFVKTVTTISNTSFNTGATSFATNLDKVVDSIDAFIKKLSTLSTTPHYASFERLANSMDKVSTASKNMGLSLSKSSIAAEKASSKFSLFRGKLSQFFTAFAGGTVIYSFVRSVKAAVVSMADLEYAMTRINTIARVSKAELAEMTKQVLDMTVKYGVAQKDITHALYEINSATITGADAMYVLESSVKAARAGFTDVNKVAELLAKTINAYGYSARDAGRLSDILFVTVERGINSMEELSQYMGRLLTVSANAGVSFEEINAGVATLTANGLQTNIAVTALNSAILKLSQGNKQLNKLFAEQGYVSSANALKHLGLAKTMEMLKNATGGTTEALTKLGFNYRDIRAVSTLASGGLEGFYENLERVKNASGETQQALEKVQDTLTNKVDQLKASWNTFLQSLNNAVDTCGTLKRVVDGLSTALIGLSKELRGVDTSFEESFSAGVLKIIGWTATIASVSLVVMKLKAGIDALITPLSTAGGAIAAAFGATTIGAIVVVSGMIAGLVVLLGDVLLKSYELYKLIQKIRALKNKNKAVVFYTSATEEERKSGIRDKFGVNQSIFKGKKGSTTDEEYVLEFTKTTSVRFKADIDRLKKQGKLSQDELKKVYDSYKNLTDEFSTHIEKNVGSERFSFLEVSFKNFKDRLQKEYTKTLNNVALVEKEKNLNSTFISQFTKDNEARLVKEGSPIEKYADALSKLQKVSKLDALKGIDLSNINNSEAFDAYLNTLKKEGKLTDQTRAGLAKYLATLTEVGKAKKSVNNEFVKLGTSMSKLFVKPLSNLEKYKKALASTSKRYDSRFGAGEEDFFGGERGIFAQYTQHLVKGGTSEEFYDKLITKYGKDASTEITALINAQIADENQKLPYLKQLDSAKDKLTKFKESLEMKPLSDTLKLSALENKFNEIKNKFFDKDGNFMQEVIADPKQIERFMQISKELHDLAGKTATVKAPTSITSMQGVQAGSKEAYDMVAKQVFADRNKTQKKQTTLQTTIANYVKKLDKGVGDVVDNIKKVATGTPVATATVGGGQ